MKRALLTWGLLAAVFLILSFCGWIVESIREVLSHKKPRKGVIDNDIHEIRERS